MTQDFAKQHRSQPAAPSATQRSRLSVFLGGFVSGCFATFLLTLWLYLPSSPDPIKEPSPKPTTQTAETSDEIQWDFYEIFPKSVVPIVEEYNDDGEKVVVTPHAWVLQAGSFKDPSDADEQRASLILMGLDVTVSPTEVAGNTWHRVIVGPFETDLALNRAKDKLAQAQVKSLPLKIPR